MDQIVIFRCLGHEAAAKEFLTANLISQDGYQVTLEVGEWIPVNAPEAIYFLDAGQADDPPDLVTCVTFIAESPAGPPFRIKGTLFPERTCKKWLPES